MVTLLKKINETTLLDNLLPDHSFKTKVKAPQGAIATNLSVLYCLYSLHEAFCARVDVGFSVKNSVASMITLVSGCFFERIWKLSLDLFTG